MPISLALVAFGCGTNFGEVLFNAFVFVVPFKTLALCHSYVRVVGTRPMGLGKWERSRHGCYVIMAPRGIVGPNNT